MAKNRLNSMDRRKQIIEASLKIVSEQGVTKFTTARLAAEVGISEAGIFKYFRSKEEILAEALEFVHDTLAQRVQTILVSDMPVKDKLRKVLSFQLNFLEKNHGIPRVVFSEQLYWGNHGLKEKFIASMDRYFNLLKKLATEGVREGVFRPDLDLDMAVSTYAGLVQITVFRWFIDDFKWSLSGRASKIFDCLLKSWS